MSAAKVMRSSCQSCRFEWLDASGQHADSYEEGCLRCGSLYYRQVEYVPGKEKLYVPELSIVEV